MWWASLAKPARIGQGSSPLALSVVQMTEKTVKVSRNCHFRQYEYQRGPLYELGMTRAAADDITAAEEDSVRLEGARSGRNHHDGPGGSTSKDPRKNRL